MAGSTLAALLSVFMGLPVEPLFVGLIASVIFIFPGIRIKKIPGTKDYGL